MKKISKANLSVLFEKIAETSDLLLPVEKGGRTDFAKYESGMTYSPALKTIKSAKDAFFPQNENITSFRRETTKIVVEPNELPSKRCVIFGVRACDAKSFDVLDNVFLAEPKDEFYEARRNCGVVITNACNQPDESCFCTVFGIDPANPGADVQTWFFGDDLYWEALTEKGEKLTAELGDILADSDDEKVNAVKSAITNVTKLLPLANLSLDKFGPGKTEALFNSPKWQELADACLGCGTCTFVCPTCQCYDIRDYEGADGIKRARCWDSCMFSDFTMCAHGTNRPTQMQRFRQRFMHKLVYYPDNNNGMFSCVGCGRCVTRCPISMNIAKVIKAFGGEE